MTALKKIRIGTDVITALSVNISGKPVTWSEGDIRHVYAFSDVQGQPVAEMAYTAEGQTLRCTYAAKDQNYTGPFRVIVEFADGKAFSSSLDVPAFEIVRTTEEADADTGEVVLDIDGTMRFYSLSEAIAKIEVATKAATDAAEKANAAAQAAGATNTSIAEAEAARVEAEKARAEAEKTREEAEAERQAKFAAALVQETGQGNGKVMSQKAVTDALAGKQEKLVPGDNITIVGNVISSTGGGGGSIDLSAYAKKEDVDAALAGKQDTIADLDAIRQGAQKGSTALQSESDPIYTADKPSLALKSELDGKQDKLTAGYNITIVDNVISSIGGGGGSVDLSAYAKTVDVNAGLATKQDKLTAGNGISIEQNVISATGGGGGSVDLSAYAKTVDVNAGLAKKQDVISDLESIREGAALGKTALQSYTETDPVYLADKPKLALKVEIPDVSGKVDKVAGKGLSSNDYTDADKLKLAGLENYDDTQVRALIAGKQDKLVPGDNITIVGNVISSTGGGGGGGSVDLSAYAKKEEVNAALAGKQDTISDLESIREGAALGKTALQSYTETDPIYMADKPNLALKSEIPDISGKQDKISDLATIRSGAAKGATALQSYTETDPIYMADKPNLALKSEIPDISGKADKTAIVTETEGNSSYRIAPNRLTQLGTLASNVTLSLNTASEEAGVVNVYDIIFSTPTNAPSITWPEGITWVGGSAPAIAGGKTYEVSIMDGLATYGEFSI